MLRFAALPSAPDIAAVTLADGLLTVTPVSEGESSVTLTAVNEAGEVSSMFIVRVVSDPAELAAVDGALAGIGRSLLNAIVASIDARFELNRGVGTAAAASSAGLGSRSGTTVVGRLRVRPPRFPWNQ